MRAPPRAVSPVEAVAAVAESTQLIMRPGRRADQAARHKHTIGLRAQHGRPGVPRGSMPGERRGGRTRGTPNQRTILVDRILAVLVGCPAASPGDRLAMLVNDPELPADIRAAVAQRAFPNRTRRARPPQRPPKSELGETAPSATVQPVETMNEAALEALIGIVCDPNASAEARRKVAVKLATYFLPMKAVNKRWRAVPDNYGFVINGERARE